MAASQDLTAPVHTIIRTTIAQYYVNQAVTQGVARQQVQPGSVTCIQRFGGAMNLHVHFHVVFLAGLKQQLLQTFSGPGASGSASGHRSLLILPHRLMGIVSSMT
jgi:hypothetical protein